MSQSTRIAAALVFLFLVFITARGELPLYLSFFSIGNGGKGAGSGASGAGASSTTSLANGVAGATGLSSGNPVQWGLQAGIDAASGNYVATLGDFAASLNPFGW